MKKLITKSQDFLPGKKIFIFTNGDFEISQAQELPEGAVLGADIPDEENTYFILTQYGGFVIKAGGEEVIPIAWRTSTGSWYDQTRRYEGDMSITDWDNVNLYILSTPRIPSLYYSGLLETEDLITVYNDVPLAINKTTLEEVWGRGDWEGITDNYNIEVYNSFSIDGTTLWGYGWDWNVVEATSNIIYEIDVATGNYNTYTLAENYEWFVQKPNGDLLVVDSKPIEAKAWVFRKTGEGTHTLTEITDQDFIDAIGDIVINMVPEMQFYTSPNTSKYYLSTSMDSGGVFRLICFDMETDEVLWDSITELDSETGLTEKILQNPVTGDFVAVISDYLTSRVVKIEGETGAILGSENFSDTWFYYNECEISYDGSKFLISNSYSPTRFFDYDTLEEIIGTPQAGIGLFNTPISKTADGYGITSGETESVNESLVGDIEIINFNDDTVTKWRPEWQKQFPPLAGEQALIPSEKGILTRSDAGQILLYTNETLDRRTIGTYTPSTNVGDPLPEGWYYDTVENPTWNPATFLNIRGPEIRSFKVNLDFGDGNGDRLYMVFPDDGVFHIYLFEAGLWVEHSQQPIPGGFVLSSGQRVHNYSRNGSGWLYSNGTGAYNLITQEFKTMGSATPGSPANLAMNVGPALHNNIEYFFASSHSHAYNHTTNTWSSVASRPGATFPAINARQHYPFLYDGFLWSVGTDGLNPRTTNIARYDISLNTWSVISTSPEGSFGSPNVDMSDTRWDTPYLVGSEIYLPNSGYKYDIDSDEWSPLPVKLPGISKNVISFRDGNIVYIIPTFLTWQEGIEQYYADYNVSAYALPGAVIPY